MQKQILLGLALGCSLFAKSEWSVSIGPAMGIYTDEIRNTSYTVSDTEYGLHLGLENKTKYRNGLFLAAPFNFNYFDTKYNTKMYLFEAGPKLGYNFTDNFNIFTSLYYTSYILENNSAKATGQGYSYGGGFEYKIKKHDAIGLEYVKGTTNYDFSSIEDISLNFDKYTIFYKYIF